MSARDHCNAALICANLQKGRHAIGLLCTIMHDHETDKETFRGDNLRKVACARRRRARSETIGGATKAPPTMTRQYM
eukprot:6214794-Pleurochrysis_carterae.AAC.3